MSESPIEWTDLTWNPVRGCRRVSPGCENCYAEKTANRFRGEGRPYHGLIRINAKGKGVWTGTAREVPEKLAEPLSWRSRAASRLRLAAAADRATALAAATLGDIPGFRRPAPRSHAPPPRLRVFVNSMSDLFHEDVSNEFIASVYGVMAACPDIDFLVLTKRPARMVEWYEWFHRRVRASHGLHAGVLDGHVADTIPESDETRWERADLRGSERLEWPLPNVHVGVSVEDQQRADERIPLLLKAPAAVRWVSAEPLLGPVDLERYLCVYDSNGEPSGPRCNLDGSDMLSWLVIGGESGPGARPYDLSWPRALIEQCKAAGVPVFHKQLGSGRPELPGRRYQEDTAPDGTCEVIPYRDRKGADMAEWPADLRVREYPGVRS